MFQIPKIVFIYQPTLFSEKIRKLNLLLHSEGCRPVCSFIHLKPFSCVPCGSTMPNSRDASVISTDMTPLSLSICFSRETDIEHLFIIWLYFKGEVSWVL